MAIAPQIGCVSQAAPRNGCIVLAIAGRGVDLRSIVSQRQQALGALKNRRRSNPKRLRCVPIKEA